MKDNNKLNVYNVIPPTDSYAVLANNEEEAKENWFKQNKQKIRVIQ